MGNVLQANEGQAPARQVLPWDEMRWDEMRWDEMRWDEMRWVLEREWWVKLMN
jgi:hypothetical protein